MVFRLSSTSSALWAVALLLLVESLKGAEAMSMTITDFCTDYTESLESYLTTRLIDFFGLDSAGISLATETRKYDCVCDRNATKVGSEDVPEFTLQCTIMYQYADTTTGLLRTRVNGEVMKFKADAKTQMAVPYYAAWFDNDIDSFLETYWQHQILFDKAGEIASCNIVDNLCPFGYSIDCNVCSNGTDISYNYTCGGVAMQSVCGAGDGDGVSPSFLWERHRNEAMNLVIENVTALACNDNESIKSVDEFCSNFTEIETLFSVELNKTLADGASIDSVTCVCGDIDAIGAMPVVCIIEYSNFLAIDGTISNPIATDTVLFATTPDKAYLKPAEMEWCFDGWGPSNYCESYKLSYGQNDFFYCDINGCVANYCAVCKDGLSVVYDCGGYSNAVLSCSREYTGSLWLRYQNTTLAINNCPGAAGAAVFSRLGD